MLLPCVLCDVVRGSSLLDNHNPDNGGFRTNADLREHLVDKHSRFVARALLAPDVTNKAHFWLLTNIAYSTNLKSSTSDEQLLASNVIENNFWCNFAFSSNQNNNGAVDNQNSNINGLDDTRQNDKMQQQLKSNGRKRKRVKIDELAIRLHSSPSSAAIDESCAITSPSVNSHGSDGNSTESSPDTGQPSQIGSKAARKATCQICFLDVCTTARQRHVYQAHLRASNLFRCSVCEYSNNNSIWEMRKHCIAVHQGNAQPLSNEENYRKDIQAWNHSCFPDWKMKKSNALWSNGVEASNPEQNVSSDDLSKFSEVENGVLIDDVKEKRPSGLMADDRICHLCWEESRYPGRHIAQKHLKKPLYECPICEGFGSYESCTVVKHINKVHPENCDTSPISNLERFAHEIRDLQTRCFPNRPMKLVRPHAGSRPRERHICQMCKIEVAQSDRQRHVYHRHLKRQRIFECPLCNFASNYDVHRVKWHIKWIHKEVEYTEPVSHENDYREEIDQLNEQCFPGWQHRRRPFWWMETDDVEIRAKNENESKTETIPSNDNVGIDEINNENTNSSSVSSSSSCSSTDNGSQNGDNAIDENNDNNNNNDEDQNDECSNVEDEGGETDSKANEDLIDEQMKEQPPRQRINEWTCMLCHKEFKPSSNFLRHVAKDHLKIPLYQCPICEGHGGQDAYEIRSHMLKVHGETGLQPVSKFEEYADDVQTVYQQCFPSRKLKNLMVEKKTVRETKVVDDSRVQCKECGQEMKTEDRQIHVYRHHLKEPRLYECPLCDFAHHACSSDVKSHIKYVHQESAHLTPKANLLEFSKQIAEWNVRCFPGWINRRLPAAALEDFNSCRLCNVEVRQTSRHIAEVHLNMSLHQCPLCEYGAAESRLVRRHMRNGHKKKEVKGLEPIANVVVHRNAFSEFHDRCFPGRPKRLSNITISDEGRRAKCRQCGSTISRKRRLVHILERHLLKTVFRCSACSFSSMHDDAVVLAHIDDQHVAEDQAQLINEVSKFEVEIESLAKRCFADWQL